MVLWSSLGNGFMSRAHSFGNSARALKIRFFTGLGFSTSRKAACVATRAV